MIRYYLGVAVEVDEAEWRELRGRIDWVWATWPDGRRFKHWSEQLRPEPWA